MVNQMNLNGASSNKIHYYGDDKHVVINIEFAKDESSILSTSNLSGRDKSRSFS